MASRRRCAESTRFSSVARCHCLARRNRNVSLYLANVGQSSERKVEEQTGKKTQYYILFYTHNHSMQWITQSDGSPASSARTLCFMRRCDCGRRAAIFAFAARSLSLPPKKYRMSRGIRSRRLANETRPAEREENCASDRDGNVELLMICIARATNQMLRGAGNGTIDAARTLYKLQYSQSRASPA